MATANFTQHAFLNVAQIIGKFGGADQLRKAMFYRQTTSRTELRRTCDLLPRLLSGHVELKTQAHE